MNNLRDDCEGVRELMLSILDSSATAEEQSLVCEHLEKCSECAKEMEIYQNTIAALRENEEELCPEPEELYLFVNCGEDPDGGISAHIKTCERCRRFAEECKILPPRETMPRSLLKQLTQGAQRDPSKNFLGELLSQIYHFLRFNPGMVSAVAAAALVVAIVWPTSFHKSQVALSPVSWEEPSLPLMRPGPDLTPRSLQVPAPKERLAVIIMLEDFKDRMPQDLVNRLYEALEPTAQQKQRFDIISPDQLKSLIEAKGVPKSDLQVILAKLAEESGVSKALVVKIVAKGEQYSIRSEFLDTKTGKITKGTVEEGLISADLEKKVREAADSVMPR